MPGSSWLDGPVKLASIETQAELNAFIAAFRPQTDEEAQYWIGGRQKTLGSAYWGANCVEQDETPWGCWEWEDYAGPGEPWMELWIPSDHCGDWPDWCQGVPPPDMDCVTGGWLPGEPDDNPNQACEEDQDENLMVLDLNHGDVPTEHGFADVDSNGLRPALIMRQPGVKTTYEYDRLWAYEFRYDGGRERYLVRNLDPATLEPDGDLWTDYDVGGGVYGDHELDGGTPTEQTRYVPGLAQQDVATSAVDYLFGDQIGTLRTMRSGGTPQVTTKRVYTAFGELVEMTGSAQIRYGYAGAWGYQEHDADGLGGPDNILGSPPTGPAIGEVFPFLHVGVRYYDPSTGRLLQRDPLGIVGGINVYLYVEAEPVGIVDPGGYGPIYPTRTQPGQNKVWSTPPADQQPGSPGYGIHPTTWVPRPPPPPPVPWWKKAGAVVGRGAKAVGSAIGKMAGAIEKILRPLSCAPFFIDTPMMHYSEDLNKGVNLNDWDHSGDDMIEWPQDEYVVD